MNKTIRNTVFTFVALGLTALGVTWNQEIIAARSPIAIGTSVLAGSDELARDFPLTLTLSREVVRLGQYQVVTIRTQPFANLDVVTVDPTGSHSREETFQTTADETGRYAFRFQVNNFRELGTFQVFVRATLGTAVAEAKDTFVVETWNPEKPATDEFSYPLLP